jgi:N-methylhydantoinase A
MRYLIGIDIGGTFTDFVSYGEESRMVEVWKELSDPTDPVRVLLQGLRAHRNRGDISNIRLGTTIATNAVLERKGGNVAYLTTCGFRDVLFIQRGNRKFHYDMSWVKPKPLVERWHCFEVDERIDARGNILVPLDEQGLRRIAGEILATSEIEAVAVCFLFSYINPSHEQRAKEILAECLPGMPVSISFEVLPKWKEYERASTTVADAYLKPVVTNQLGTLRERLADGGITAPVVLIKSNGGEMTLERAAEAPVNLMVSGPTGGVVASRYIASVCGIDQLVTLDMGGTSTDVSTVLTGRESFTTAFEIEWGLPIQIPMVDIRTIGAGGGSIAWIDKGGMLRVGPQSAGADPGPACYGRGGRLPTVTDANLLLGRIDPDKFLGGRMQLDPKAARAALERIAVGLGRSVEDTAMSVVQIANNNMVGALRSVLIERGLDPRDFTLCAFGGAGPLHASELMAEMGIPRAIIPNYPAQLSAYGFIMTNPRVDRQRTTQLTSVHFNAARGAEIMDQLVGDAAAELKQQGYSEDIEVYRALEMRYLGQNYELELPVGPHSLAPERAGQLWNAFHDAHEARFGFKTPGEIIEIVTYAVTLVAATAKPELPHIARANEPPLAVSRRPVAFPEGMFDVPIFERGALRGGHVIVGPALVNEAASVTVVNHGQRLSVDAFGHLVIEVCAS